MPRRPRFDLPGTIHHICIRGIDGWRLFADRGHALDLRARFASQLREGKSECLAWSFDVNHAHWLVHRGERPMAELMERSTSRFAQRLNRERERVGHVLQGRYQSRLIRDEFDLRWMAIYTLGNPVRHEIVDIEALDDYADSAWAAVMGLRSPDEFESVEPILRLFGGTDFEARSNLRRALAEAVATKWRRPVDPRLDRIVEAACVRHGIHRSQFDGATPTSRAAKLDAALRALSELGLTWRDVEQRLGISQSTVARALRAR
jgi:REP element-mobilizing transposase RayT